MFPVSLSVLLPVTFPLSWVKHNTLAQFMQEFFHTFFIIYVRFAVLHENGNADLCKLNNRIIKGSVASDCFCHTALSIITLSIIKGNLYCRSVVSTNLIVLCSFISHNL